MLAGINCMLGLVLQVTITTADTVIVPDRHIRVADVIDMTTVDLDLRDKISKKIIASHTGSQAYINLSQDQITHLLRRRIPILKDLKGERHGTPLRVEFTALQPDGPICYKFKAFVEAGRPISRQDLAPASCDPQASRVKVKFDKLTGVVRAKRDVEVGSYAGRLAVPQIPFADRGDELLLRVAIGPVQIERTVWALQPTHKADKVFVKDRDGNVLRVPIVQPGEASGKEIGAQ